MSLLLAPYNDSMRLGMGFNSYTQALCQDKAVVINNTEVVRGNNPSQVVTYSAKLVEHLSDIVNSMNISYSSSIKKGTVSIAGSSEALNEDKIKQSDINALISVKVVNQTTIAKEDSEFVPLGNVRPGTQEFNDAYGDCYISGFIEGGDFNGIVSIRSVDRTKTEKITSEIKKTFGSTGDEKSRAWSMDTWSEGSASDVLHDAETTISVSWMGGGQIKDAGTRWTMGSVFDAAAAFPSYVAACPQKTWAILTKYKANRSFNEHWCRLPFSPLEYDAIASYTSELFDNYMEYKQMLKLVQDMLTNPANYCEKTWKNNYIKNQVSSLISAKAAFRIEMAKIVRAVDVLSKDPGVLKRSGARSPPPSDATIRQIIRDALGDANWQGSSYDMASFSEPPPSQAASDPTATSTQVAQPVALPPASTANVVPEGSSTALPAQTPTTGTVVSAPISFNFNQMISPEIFTDLLPALIADAPPPAPANGVSIMPASLVNGFPLPPPGEAEDLTSRTKPGAASTAVEVLAATCGFIDVTDIVRSWVDKATNSFQFRASAIKGLLDGHPNSLVTADGCFLSIVYQYPGASPRIVVAKPETSSGNEDTTTSYLVQPATTSFPVLEATPWDADSWSIGAWVYGAKLYTDKGVLQKITDLIKRNRDGGKGTRSIQPSNELVNEDPWPGMFKLAHAYYYSREGGRLRITSGLESKIPCTLTESVGQDTVADTKKPAMTMRSELQPAAARVIFKANEMRIETASDEPFLSFANDIRFCWQPDANLVVYQGTDVKWSSGSHRAERNSTTLSFQADANLCGYNSRGDCVYASNSSTGSYHDPAAHIILSNMPPYLDIGAFDSAGNWSSRWKSG